MSNRLVHKIILFLAIILPFIACDRLIYDQPVDGDPGDIPKVYLSVNIQTARVSGLRTINDNTNFEDRVHDLALLVFDSSTGQIVAKFVDEIDKDRTSYTFTLELTPGQRDFYFVANMPKGDFDAIPDRKAMDTYMRTFTEGIFDRDLDPDLYLESKENKGFPMSRVYTNQDVTRGGTAIQPKLFMPVPVAGEPAESEVKLRRVVAKLEVYFGPEDIDKIKNVYYKNAFRQFSLTAPEAPPYTPQVYHTASSETPNGNPLRKVGNSYIYYMPEALMNNPSWEGTGSHAPINYFVIETFNDVHEIPIITNTLAEISSSYLEFAYGNAGGNPNYNIYRNHHYKYTVNNLENIEITYIINPWSEVKKQLFMGYGYNVEVDEDGNISITNTLDDCMPHKVRLEAMNGAVFTGDPAPIPENVVEFGYDSGDTPDPLKMKTGYSEQFKIDTEAVGVEEVYMEVFYNGVSVYTFKK